MNLKHLALITLFAFSTVALGLEGVQKSNIKLPFHHRIDTSSSDKAKLESQIKDLYKKDSQKIAAQTEEEKIVSDFMDVEVHWGGKSENVVDRRMNSVNQPPALLRK